MNLRDLQYLVAVAEQQHFGKAAKTCFVSQPALSMQLQKLEDTLGVQLFERSNKKVIITNAGKDIAKRAKIILTEAKEIKATAKSYQDPFSGKLKLAAFPTLAPYLFPSIVPKISSNFPKLKLLLLEEKTAVLISLLQAGEIDAAFLSLPIEEPDLTYKELFTDEFLLAVPPSHPLTKHKTITNKNLNKQTLLLLEEGHCLRNQALTACELLETTEQQDFRATSLETLRQMVVANVGVTLIPSIAKLDNDGLIYLPFKKNRPSRKIALVWRKTSAKTAVFNKLSGYIVNTS